MVATSVMAYEPIAGAVAPDSGGFVGLGVGYTPDYEGSDDNKGVAAPFGKYIWESGRYVSLGGSGGAEKAARLSLNIISKDWSEMWEFGPLLQYRFKRDDNVDDDNVGNMRVIDAATEAGLFGGLNVGPWSASLSFAADASDEYSGYVVYAKGSYKKPINERFLLNFSTHLTYASEDYMDTYFGVSPENASRSGLQQYSADSGIKDTGGSITALYNFNKSWGIAGHVAYTRLLGDAEDSPLVADRGDENQVSTFIAALYSF